MEGQEARCVGQEARYVGQEARCVAGSGRAVSRQLQTVAEGRTGKEIAVGCHLMMVVTELTEGLYIDVKRYVPL